MPIRSVVRVVTWYATRPAIADRRTAHFTGRFFNGPTPVALWLAVCSDWESDRWRAGERASRQHARAKYGARASTPFRPEHEGGLVTSAGRWAPAGEVFGSLRFS